MAFASILAPAVRRGPPEERPQDPDFFCDLHLDQIFTAVAADYQEYDLVPFYRVPVADIEELAYRQAVMQDLEREDVRNAVCAFAASLREVRRLLAQEQKLHYPQEKQACFVRAVVTYCSAVRALDGQLQALAPQSEGARELGVYLAGYAASPAFDDLSRRATALAAGLAGVQFSILIGDDNSITVRRFCDEPDYTAAVQDTFARFRQGQVKDYRSKFTDSVGFNHIEAQIVERVALLHPQLFEELHDFSAANREFQDPVVRRFDREVHFYLAYLAQVRRLRDTGLPFCYPAVSAESKELRCRAGFDLSLAIQLAGKQEAAVVCNDFELHDPERILVVSGANQGGKTTFARMFGQLHYLASLGCLVPAQQARLFLCDAIYTHFEREENVATLRGKLYDDLVRMHAILESATGRSLIVMNEIFSSTALMDASFLAREVIGRISDKDALALCVTFMTELATLGEKTVSFVGQVDPRDPSIRTFRVERKAADGQAHAMALARKYGLTYDQMRERLAQ